MTEELDSGDIQKAKKGDKQAFDRLINLHRAKVISICRRYMRENEEALDASQDVFCAVYRNLTGFNGGSKFSTWLYRVTVNTCINKLKELKRKRAGGGDLESDRDGGLDVEDKKASTLENMEISEVRVKIINEMHDFEDDEKSIIILRELELMDYKEISRVLKMPMGSVKSKLSRAREKLFKRIIKKFGGSHEM